MPPDELLRRSWPRSLQSQDPCLATGIPQTSFLSDSSRNVAAVDRRDDDVVKRSTKMASGGGGTVALLKPDQMQIRAQSIDPSSLLPMRDAFPPSSSTHLHARASGAHRTALDS